MFADGFDYKTAAGLHRDRLNEAESIRRAETAKKSAAEAESLRHVTEGVTAKRLKYRIGKQLIALGERMTA